jgi:type IV/VI secretion system ImpK/VasF family protein
MNKKAYIIPLQMLFQEFYYELLRQKERALRLGEGMASLYGGQLDVSQNDDFEENESTEILPENNGKAKNRDLVNLVHGIQDRLARVIDDQQKNISLKGGNAEQIQVYRDAHYVMAALADEVFLNLSWPGVSTWQKSMLETRIFGSQVAGETFFTKLDELMVSTSIFRVDLAYVYYMALSFGFKGKFRSTTDEDQAHQYQSKLLAILSGDNGSLLDGEKKHLIDSAYNATFTGSPTKGLPDVKTWAVWISGVAIVYIIITYVVWYKLSSDIHQALNQIFEQSRRQPLT